MLRTNGKPLPIWSLGKFKSNGFSWIHLILTGYSHRHAVADVPCGWFEVRENLPSLPASGLVRIPDVLFVTLFFVSRLYISLPFLMR